MKIPLHLSYSFASHYQLHLEVSDPEVLRQLKNYLETHDLVTFRTRGKRAMLRTDLKITKAWTSISKNVISVDAGNVDYIFLWTKNLDKEVYDIHLSLNMPSVSPVKLLPKWEDILREDQKEDIRALTRFFGGLSVQHTGYGKTTMLIALIESLSPAKCLILVPSSGIMSEIQSRGERFGVEIPNYKWANQAEIINPIGFLQSKEVNNPLGIQWLNDVRYVLTDEVHHMQCVSYSKMFSHYLPNVSNSYGFSASPDVKEGEDLSPVTMSFRDLGHKNAKILGLSGSIRVRRRSTAKITIVKVRTEIVPESLKESLKKQDWSVALDTMMCRPFCAQVIATILDKYQEIRFYIPIHKVATGIQLYKNLINEGVQGIFWSEKHLFPEKEDKKEADLLFIKRLVVDPACRFLMTTSVGFEGIDVPSLAGIIPLIGTSYRMVVQPSGRAVRGGSLVYVMIYDKHNVVVQKQMDKRLVKIKQEYDNIEQTLTLKVIQ